MKFTEAFPELDSLAVVPAEALLLHEAHDFTRLDRLKNRIASEGMQANPIIASVVGTAAGPEGFLVLDGAHRAETLRSLGCRLALVQLVEPPTFAEGWKHLVELGATGNGQARSRLEKVLTGSAQLSGGSHDPDRLVAEIRLSDSDFLEVVANGTGTGDLAAALRGIQKVYPPVPGVVRRLAPGEEVNPQKGEVVISYRPFPTAGIIEEITAGRTLPAGITRFSVPGRILGVGMPLELLVRGDEAGANRWLQAKVSSHLEENRIRRYDEPVTLFE